MSVCTMHTHPGLTFPNCHPGVLDWLLFGDAFQRHFLGTLSATLFGNTFRQYFLASLFGDIFSLHFLATLFGDLFGDTFGRHISATFFSNDTKLDKKVLAIMFRTLKSSVHSSWIGRIYIRIRSPLSRCHDNILHYVAPCCVMLSCAGHGASCYFLLCCSSCSVL